MLQPFFQFGIVTDSLPFQPLVSEQKQKSAIVTCCDNCVVLRSASSLSIWAKSDLLPGKIRAHTSNFDWTYVSCGDCVVHALHRGRNLDIDRSLGCSDHVDNDFVRSLLILGNSILFVGHDSGSLCVWHIQERRLLSSVNLEAPIKLLSHPATYVNKVMLTLAGPTDRIVLWNAKLSNAIAQYHMPSKVNCVVQSPAIDICAIGLDDGNVALLNLKSEQMLFILRAEQSHRGVTAIAFHTDKQYLLAGRRDGSIDLFDLEKRRVIVSGREESLGRVTELSPVAGYADLFCASYEGNALIQWMVTDGDSAFQQRRRYVGNMEPVTKCHFMPDSDSLLAVCGHHVLIWNSAISALNYVKHRASYDVAVYDAVLASRRASTLLMPEWADIVIIHKECRRVSLARMDGKKEFSRSGKQGQKLPDWFEPAFYGDDPIPATSHVTCCTISSCCNFAALGYTCGHIVVFNLQSREERLRLSCAEPVRALAFDVLNRFLLFGSEQGLVGIRPFRARDDAPIVEDRRLSSGITGQFSAHRSGSLFAVPLADSSVSILRLTGGHIEPVRRVVCAGPVTFAKFSDDGRFLACSSLDSTLRLFDVASGSQLDCLRLKQPAVCFDFRDDLLACACRGSLQLSVFACAFYYEQIKVAAVTDRSENLLTACLKEPACSGWRSFDRVDEMLKSNQPEPALAKPRNAPFFLPAVPTLTGFKLVDDKPAMHVDATAKSAFVDSTELTRMLQDPFAGNTFNLLKKLNVIQLEFEIGNLLRMAANPEGHQFLERFVSLLKLQLERRVDFDFAAAVVSRLAAKLCSEVANTAALGYYLAPVRELLQTAKSLWQPVECDYERSLCFTAFLKNDPL